MNPPHICPQCGVEVSPNARACPKCGSDGHTRGPRNTHDPIGDPDDDFDYDAFIREEFNDQTRSMRPHGISFFWWIVAIVLLIAFISLWVL